MIPNFRVPHRLIEWMQVHNVRERVPSREHLFFKDSLCVRTRTNSLVAYARLVGRLPLEMEDLIAQVPIACFNYASFLRNIADISEKIEDGACVEPGLIVKMAGLFGKRIPRHEDKLDADLYIEYCALFGERVPEIEERVFFSESAPREARAKSAVALIRKLIGFGYGRPSHAIMDDPRIRDLIKDEPNAVMTLMEIMSSRGAKLDGEFFWSLRGDGHRLFKLAENIKGRLPLDLEATWEGYPHELVKYAARWVRGPLPESLEYILLGDTQAVADYAFQVIRANASPRLSGALHNFMVMSQDEHVRRYIGECERVEGQMEEWAARF